MTCARCGTEAPNDARFCSSCGAPLDASGIAEERKVVSVLFVDVVGSTERADGADPEDVRTLNQLYYVETSARIEAYGGAIEKYVGDAVMAVFGAPVAHSDDAERAVRASLSVLEGIEQLNAEHAGLDLQVRAAVCTGEAMVAVDAAPADALATGDVINTAARLQSAARPGTVVVGAETHRLTEHAFRFEPLEAIDAKGKRDPVEAWLVIEPLVAPAERPTSGTPFVGRERELLLIDLVWDGAVNNATPHLVSVIGPAGIGKSRLAQELTDRVEEKGARTLLGRCLPYEEQTPYRAFGQIVRRAAGIFENDSAEEARRKLTTFVQALFPETETTDTVRHLSLVLGLGSGETADDPIHLLFSSRRVVELIAEQEPLLLVFEDVHWADDAMLDLVDYLVTHVRDHPVVFLALARPEFLETRTGFGSGHAGQTTLHLEPLSAAESTRVVTELASSADTSVVTAVVERAEGNPLFLEELAASVGASVNGEQLPGTVRAAIAARIDALPADARTALLHASVVGPTFWRDIVAGIGALDDIDLALEALEARGLVRRSGQSQVQGDVEFAFKHVLVRDVAYATLPKAVRRDLHGAVAELIESSVPDPTELAWILAHHYREAGRPDRAVAYLVAAGDRARAALAIEQTWDFYSRAIELATTEEERRRIRLRRALAHVELGWSAEFRQADEEFAVLIPELDGPDRIDALLARSRANHWTEEEDGARDTAQEALDLARATGDAEREAAAFGRLGAAYGMSGGPGDLARARELQQESLRLWPAGARPVDLAEVLHLTGNVDYWVGDYDASVEHFQASRDIGASDPRSAEALMRGASGRAVALAGTGRYEEAIEASEAGIDAMKLLGHPYYTALNYSTLTLREIFAVEEAAKRSAMVADSLGPSDFNMPWMNARADVLVAALLADDFATIDRDFETTWEDAVTSQAWERWLVSGRLAVMRAEADRLRGRLDDAATWARRALDLAVVSGRSKYEAAARTTLGALLGGEDDEAALEHLRAAVTIADDLGSPLLRWRALAALGTVERHASAAGVSGEAHLREAATIIRDVAASLSPERSAGYLAAPEVVTTLEAAS